MCACNRRADGMHRCFDAKVASVRASTSDAPPPSFTAAPLGCVLRVFRSLSIVDVVATVRALPKKQYLSDPLPTKLLKDDVDVFAPFLVELFNRSLPLGVVPLMYKSAYAIDHSRSVSCRSCTSQPTSHHC